MGPITNDYTYIHAFAELGDMAHNRDITYHEMVIMLCLLMYGGN